jgi:hypothetical protein
MTGTIYTEPHVLRELADHLEEKRAFIAAVESSELAAPQAHHRSQIDGLRFRLLEEKGKGMDLTPPCWLREVKPEPEILELNYEGWRV